MKKKKARRTKFELRSRIKINSFEKNPTNGGMPAIDNRDTINNFVETCVPLKCVKEYKVLKLVNESWNMVVNRTNKAKLYMKTYDQRSNTVVVVSCDKIIRKLTLKIRDSYPYGY